MIGATLLTAYRKIISTPRLKRARAKAGGVLRYRIAGISLEAPADQVTPSLHNALAEGYYEGTELAMVRSIVRAGDRVLDVGAGIGFMSIVAATSASRVEVTAIEANRQLIDSARRNFRANKVSVDLRCGLAVPDCPPNSTATFYIHPGFWASSPLAGSGHPVSVEALSIAALIAEFRPDVILVDVEGAEATLFDRADLSGVRTVVIELHEKLIGPADIRGVFQTMFRAGLDYDVRHSRGRVVTFSRP